MPADLAERRGTQKVVQIQRDRMVARQTAEEVLGEHDALAVEHIETQGQRPLRLRHRVGRTMLR